MIKFAIYLTSTISILMSTGVIAAVLTPLPPVPGSAPNSTLPLAITDWLGVNEEGVVTGVYSAGGSLHGFRGYVTGHDSTFDVPPGGTVPRAINLRQSITGRSGAGTCDPHENCPEFERSYGGEIVPITKDGVQLRGGTAAGILTYGGFIGDYHPDGTSYGTQVGYFGYEGTYAYSITLPFATFETNLRGLDNSPRIVGFFLATGLPGDKARGFERSAAGVRIIDYPDPNETGTYFEGINDTGWITGIWSDAGGNLHAFLLSPDRTTFTDINVPGATQVEAFGINNQDEVAVATDIGGFIYCMREKGGACAHRATLLVRVSGRRVTAGSIRTIPCLNNCSFAGGTPSVFINQGGDPNRALVKSPAASRLPPP